MDITVTLTIDIFVYLNCKVFTLLHITVSAYLEKLQQENTDVAARYLDKIRVIGSVDPYTLSSADLDYGVDAIPPITRIDIVSYLVLTHSFYRKDQTKAYKSL
ncbi:hypothetical protein FQA39_LY14709 [Lamprigera yunnana]|nr:hypothetical protein FQA39_LY14709 [Lamprigera yunnana]